MLMLHWQCSVKIDYYNIEERPQRSIMKLRAVEMVQQETVEDIGKALNLEELLVNHIRIKQ
ncbi:Hypothetical protein FKW44_024732 [Caligus rogercresseyi]|uniref:Uncharacterized protein n=2 Tax=Caligus rogercresseyi TaxID=217165 RepID=A0A7T8JT15_CALRO|nr:Hypothetical protein FKW44_024732 [Caligus rogercresseyi]